ncbi:hypothetical protein A2U01_0034300, partial [Trifolium medium]|nr:hypothetical protein [Trifolium medium]
DGWRTMVSCKQTKLQFKRYNFSLHSAGIPPPLAI